MVRFAGIHRTNRYTSPVSFSGRDTDAAESNPRALGWMATP